MKVNDSSSGMRVTLENSTPLKVGTRLRARLLDATGPKQGLIEFAGQRVKAHFSRGVPVARSFTLEVLSSSGQTLHLKLVEGSGGEEKGVDLAGELARTLGISGSQEMIHRTLSTVYNGSLFQLFRKMIEEKGKSRDISTLFSRLDSLDLSSAQKQFLRMTISSFFIPDRLFFALLRLMYGKKEIVMSEKEEDFRDVMNKLTRSSDNDIDEEAKSFIKDIISVLASHDVSEGLFFRIAYPEEAAPDIQVAVDEGMLVSEFESVNLGRIVAVIRYASGHADVRLFTDSSESLRELNSAIDSLEKILADDGFSFSVLIEEMRSVEELIRVYKNGLHSARYDWKV